MNTYLNLIAWVFAVGSTLLIGLRVLCWLTYTERDILLDSLKGVRRVFPLFIPSLVAVLTWLWVIVKPLG